MERTRRSTTELVPGGGGASCAGRFRFFFGPYRGLFSEWPILALTIGRRKVDASASRCFLSPQDASPQPHPHVASFPSRVSALRFPFPHPRLQSLLAWPHAVSLRVTARTEARPNRCRTRRGRVGRNSDLLLFSKDRSVGEASAAIYRLPSNYQIPH